MGSEPVYKTKTKQNTQNYDNNKVATADIKTTNFSVNVRLSLFPLQILTQKCISVYHDLKMPH